MKGIMIKTLIMLLLTIGVSVGFGNYTKHNREQEILEMNKQDVMQEDYTILEEEPNFVTFIVFGVITMVLMPFYIRNICMIISMYSATKEIEDENIIYQRDLSDDYNSAIASYIIDGVVEEKQDYKAVLIELQNKELIYKENGKYKLNENKINLENNLLENQKIVLEQIRQGNINLNEFKKAVIKDSNNLGYTKINTAMIFFIMMFLIMTPFLIFAILYLIFGSKAWLMSLTTKGKEEKDKILKLKRYLVNYSNLKDLESTDYNIWDEYLAYAVSLNVNKKLKVTNLEI